MFQPHDALQVEKIALHDDVDVFVLHFDDDTFAVAAQHALVHLRETALFSQ